MEQTMSLRQATLLLLRVIASKFILTSGQKSRHAEPRRKPVFQKPDQSGAEVMKPRRWL
ncbi:hypothetical protein [Bhargavaea massiliensis]|uniref:hypothetical protein n=1 Tax=Bhargavaea massiliensis TaxID=2697500 RepID=UPI001BD17597|nr:hypothetical protein [Bhargavaea massiliensis]